MEKESYSSLIHLIQRIFSAFADRCTMLLICMHHHFFVALCFFFDLVDLIRHLIVFLLLFVRIIGAYLLLALSFSSFHQTYHVAFGDLHGDAGAACSYTDLTVNKRQI